MNLPSRESRVLIDALEYSKPSRERFLEWQTGRVGAVHVTLAVWENAAETDAAIAEWRRLLEDNEDLIALARSAGEIRAIAKSGRTAVVFGFQNTSPFEDNLDMVGHFRDLGVRIVQLTYNIQNSIGSGYWEPEDAGLSSHLGRNFVRELNEAGMLIDLSHCGERTCLDAINFSESPVAVTHANPEEYVGNEIELVGRGKSPRVLDALVARGGVVGLSMYPRTLPAAGYRLDQFCDMVSWTVDRLGIDHVGFGTDFYAGQPAGVLNWWRSGRWARTAPSVASSGTAQWPEWFMSPAQFPEILDGLARRGMVNAEIDKVAGGNWLRLFDETFHDTDC